MQQLSEIQSELPSYLEGLNPEQQQAVLTTDGPLLVLAGAGTGKTRVLTTRIAHLINTRRAFPGQILSVTFTNKAAAEMRGRVAQLLFGNQAAPQEASSLWLGTFHSIGAKILRRHAELVGLTPQFTILDDDDQQRLIKAMLADNNIDHTKFPTRAVLGVIQSWKDRGLTYDKIPEKPGNYTLAQVAGENLSDLSEPPQKLKLHGFRRFAPPCAGDFPNPSRCAAHLCRALPLYPRR